MCSRKSKTGSSVFTSGLSRRLVLVLCLLLVVSSLQAVGAWSGFLEKEKDTKTVIVTSPVEVRMQETSSSSAQPLVTATAKSQPSSTASTQKSMKEVQKILSESEAYKNELKLVQEELITYSQEIDSLKAELEKSKRNAEHVEKLNELKDSMVGIALPALDAASVANAEQADELAYTKGKYDEATGSKFVTRLTALMGFKDGSISYGAGASMGVRFGKHFIVDIGANYILGTMNNLIEKPSLDNLQIVAGIGWEW